jgi:Arc/MetJ family transcription regulator
MRTNIDIDDALLAEAMKAAGLATKKATVEEALRRLVQSYERRKAINDLRGVGRGRRSREDAARPEFQSYQMIVVDRSVWIGQFRGADTRATSQLNGVIDENEIIVGDLVPLEVLQGARDGAHASRRS